MLGPVSRSANALLYAMALASTHALCPQGQTENGHTLYLASGTTLGPGESCCFNHVIRHGETCNIILSDYNTTTTGVYLANGTDCLWGGAPWLIASTLQVSDDLSVCGFPNATGGAACFPYAVAAGDSCAAIQSKFGTSAGSITRSDSSSCASSPSLDVDEVVDVCSCTQNCLNVTIAPCFPYTVEAGDSCVAIENRFVTLFQAHEMTTDYTAALV
jgi:hypothetical protein